MDAELFPSGICANILTKYHSSHRCDHSSNTGALMVSASVVLMALLAPEFLQDHTTTPNSLFFEVCSLPWTIFFLYWIPEFVVLVCVISQERWRCSDYPPFNSQVSAQRGVCVHRQPLGVPKATVQFHFPSFQATIRELDCSMGVAECVDQAVAGKTPVVLKKSCACCSAVALIRTSFRILASSFGAV
jgi:hypothetical protein